MSDAYRCDTCGTPFKFQQKLKNHIEQEHQGRLTDYEDSDELLKLQGLMRGLENNDYDKKLSNTDKSSQRNLRNKRVHKNGQDGSDSRQKQLSSY